MDADLVEFQDEIKNDYKIDLFNKCNYKLLK